MTTRVPWSFVASPQSEAAKIAVRKGRPDLTRQPAQDIRAALLPLVAEARAKGKWLWCRPDHRLVSPDELDAANAEGRLLYGPINWHLKAPPHG